MTTGAPRRAAQPLPAPVFSRQRVAGVGARRGRSKKGAQSRARRTSTPARGALAVAARQSRPVDGGRKSRSQMDEKERERDRQKGKRRERERERGWQSRWTKRNDAKNAGRTARRRGGKEARSERQSVTVSYVVSAERTEPRAEHREPGVTGWSRAAGGGRARAEPDAHFRAQYARRARPVRCRVRVVEVVTSVPSPE